MAKLENYVELAQQTMREISADGEAWRAFLTTASNVCIMSFQIHPTSMTGLPCWSATTRCSSRITRRLRTCWPKRRRAFRIRVRSRRKFWTWRTMR